MNINGVHPDNNNAKNDIIKQEINDNEFDIYGFTETNRCWHLLPQETRWHERTIGWWETLKSTVSYNTQDIDSVPYQPGGAMLLSINKTAHRAIESGVDERGLGRWAWTLYRGKHNTTLKIISAYRPSTAHKNSDHSIFNEKIRYLIFPMKKILSRLKIFLRSCVHIYFFIGTPLKKFKTVFYH